MAVVSISEAVKRFFVCDYIKIKGSTTPGSKFDGKTINEKLFEDKFDTEDRIILALLIDKKNWVGDP